MNEKITHDIQNLNSEIARFKESLSLDEETNEAKLLRLSKIVQSQSFWRNEIKSLDDVPGIRKPQWYVVDIPFEYGDEIERNAVVNISANNAFVCRQMQSYYLLTDDDEDHYERNATDPHFQSRGRTLPTSAFYPYMQASKISSNALIGAFSKATYPTGTIVEEGYMYPDFEFRIEIEGTGRYWVSEKIPAASLYGVFEPFYLGFQGVLENTDKVRVYATPTTPIGLKGVVRLVMHGYSIGSQISIQNQLGY